MKAEVVYTAILLGWLLVSAILLIWLRVFSPAPLARAPARQHTLSLPIVGGVIALYYFFVAVVISAAVGSGYVSMAQLSRLGSQPAEPVPASMPTTAIAHTATEAANAPDASATPESEPATTAESPAPAATGAQSVPSATATAAAEEAAAGTAVSEKDDLLAASVINSSISVLTAVAIVLLVPWFFRERFRGWGLGLRQFPISVVQGLLGFLIIYPILLWSMIGLGALYERFGHKITEHMTFEALQQPLTLGQRLFVFVGAVVVAPIAEECFFRGLLQKTLTQYGWGFFIPQFNRGMVMPEHYRPPVLQRWAAIAIAGLAFAMMHQLDHRPIIFVLALGLGYIYERTGNLSAAIMMHAWFNASQLVLFAGN